MCGKRSLKAVALSVNDNDETTNESPKKKSTKAKAGVNEVKMNGHDGESNVKIKRDETPEEKAKRRKLERRLRRLNKLEKTGKLPLPPIPGYSKKVLAKFNNVWDRESAFVTQVMQCLPEVRQPGLLLEEEEKVEEYIEMEVDDEDKEKKKAEKFHAKVRRNLEKQGLETTTERAKSYQELREKLHRKIAELAQAPNQEKREKKMKKKLKRAQEAKEKSNKGKKLISQSAKSAGASNEDSASTSTPQSEQPEKKIPLKKPVVKFNGEVVFSKVDFISKHKGDHLQPSFGEASKKTAKPKPEELLKKVEKQEKMISSLTKDGKHDEAVSLVEKQKWDTAMKRADGDKVRDDAYLLKKTVKKQEKMKQLSKKKWKERVDRVEKQKEMRQEKRQTNIQKRKEDNKKRSKKIMRKRGRIV